MKIRRIFPFKQSAMCVYHSKFFRFSRLPSLIPVALPESSVGAFSAAREGEFRNKAVSSSRFFFSQDTHTSAVVVVSYIEHMYRPEDNLQQLTLKQQWDFIFVFNTKMYT
jgi:hypothetical protein